MNAAWIVAGKELEEIRRSPVLLLSMISLPVTTVVIPVLVLLYLARAAPDVSVLFMKELYGASGESTLEVLASAAAKAWLPMFLVMPVFLPILVAAQSVGGERERRTLEPLLATPVSTAAIVLGKSVAAILPAVLITWIAGAIFAAALDLLAGRVILPNAEWAFAIGVLAPLLALFGNAMAVAVSTRVLDPRAAQNLAAMTVVPLIALVVAVLMGQVHPGLPFYAAMAAGVAVLDVLLVRVAARLFDRERLLVL